MYYNTPNINKYVDLIIKFRKQIILFYLLLTALLAFFYQPNFLSSDELFWLKNSKELVKTTSKKYTTFRVSKLSVNIETFDELTLQKLKLLQKKLEHLDGVVKVSSIFSNDYIETKKEKNSEIIVVVNSSELDTLKTKKLLKELHNGYCNVVENDFKKFYFFISSTKTLDIDTLNIPGKYQYSSLDHKIHWQVILLYFLIFTLLVLIIFRIFFRNYISVFAALIHISLTTFLTFSMISMITNISAIHIAMPFIAISISLVEFLYFYHRWHILQHKKSIAKILRKMLNRSMIPAMWTSILTLLGLGSLVLIDSDIIKLLSLSVILSSVIGYILNLTLLPAFLSYLGCPIHICPIQNWSIY